MTPSPHSQSDPFLRTENQSMNVSAVMKNANLLFTFSDISDFSERLQSLASIAEPEDWEYHNTYSEHPLPILFNYLKHTFNRVYEEGKISYTSDDSSCCFNTGLVSTHQEAIYTLFQPNMLAAQKWYLKAWLRKGEYQLTKFPRLPDLAHYFDDPSCLIFDDRKEFRVNVEHILQENRDRFPEEYRSMSQYAIQCLLDGAITSARQRVRRNYKTAIPQYY